MTFKGLFYTAHLQYRSAIEAWIRTIVIGLICSIITNCAQTPTSIPATKPTAVVQPTTSPTVTEEELPEAITHAIEDENQVIVIDDPWELLAQAKVATNTEAPALLLRAAAVFLKRGQRYTAQSTVDQLENYQLTKEQRIYVLILQGQLAAAAGQHAGGISLLHTVDPDHIQNLDTRKQVLNTLATSQIALNRKSDAVATLLDLDLLLENQEQLENQQTILKLLQSMNPLQLSLLKENPFAPMLEGWVALTDTLKTTTPPLRQKDVNNWRALYPNHPIQPQLLNQNVALSQLDYHNQIALLLPLTSPYGSAARAFYDGFMWAHNNDFSAQSPDVILYDLGEEPNLTSFYYQVAVNEGADLIVGPLGRRAADALLSTRQPEVMTLLIAEVLPDYAADNLFGISLSPEKEARQVADKAFLDGHRQATVFRTDNEWGGRVATAFTSQWERLGGTVVKSSSFPSGISDYSRVIQKFLGLDKSIARQRLLEAQVETKLHFSPRRNEDMDVLFLAANADQSRLVVPQLRFFQAHDLPVYATSYAYSGNPNPAVDADLDGLVLGDMKWMFDSLAMYKLDIIKKASLKSVLDSQIAETNAPDSVGAENEPAEVTNEIVMVSEDLIENGESEQLVNENPYQYSALNRLYALGLQSYQLAPRLKSLRNNNWEKFIGDAMTASVDEDGNVIRHPVWAKFVSGLAEPIDPIDQITANTISQ